MMDGVEVGRVNVAARMVGVANRTFEVGITYAAACDLRQEVADHQAVLFRLAEMGTNVQAAYQMMVRAAKINDRGERNDFEAGMAEYLAAESRKEAVEHAFRIHGATDSPRSTRSSARNEKPRCC